MPPADTTSIESRQSWIAAWVSLLVVATAFGTPWISAVALKAIAAEAGGARAIPSFAVALVWIGGGVGGIAMGRIADKVGVRWTVMFGAVMIALGAALSTYGPGWQLYVGHGLFMGLIGLAGINAPLYVYVTQWFDRRRGSALALITSGTYLGGALWPPLFERAIAQFGWRTTMIWYGLLVVIVVVPLAALFLKRPPEAPPARASTETLGSEEILRWPPNLVFVLLAAAIFMCCVPMSMPQQHLVALCTDIGINAAHGAAMLSLLLSTAFFSRQVWGLVSDRIGGLRTVLIGSGCQALAMSAFLLTQEETGLFTVAAVFGLGFSGLIPATILAARELFPADEASWRIPTLLLTSSFGMASGGWLAGVLYDRFGSYGPPFATGVAVNLAHFAIISLLLWRQTYVWARA